MLDCRDRNPPADERLKVAPVQYRWVTLPHNTSSIMGTHEAQPLLTSTFIFNSHAFHKSHMKQAAYSHLQKEEANVHRTQVVCVRSQSLFDHKPGNTTLKRKATYLLEKVCWWAEWHCGQGTASEVPQIRIQVILDKLPTSLRQGFQFVKWAHATTSFGFIHWASCIPRSQKMGPKRCE